MIEPLYRLITKQDTVSKAIQIFKTHRILGVDIETTGLEALDESIVTVQIATSRYAYIFPSTLDLRALVPVLTDPSILKVIQNAPFDFGFLYKHLGITTRPIWDTRAAEKMLGASGADAGLRANALKYTGTTIEKGSVTTSFKVGEALNEEQLAYGALDALVLIPIYIEQERILRPQNKCGLLMAQVAQSLEAEQSRIDQGVRKDFGKPY